MNIHGEARIDEGFGEWLFEARKARRLTQHELARRIHRSPSYLSMLERSCVHPLSGHLIRPSRETVDSIARALDIPTDSARLMAGYAPANLILHGAADRESDLADRVAESESTYIPNQLESIRQAVREVLDERESDDDEPIPDGLRESIPLYEGLNQHNRKVAQKQIRSILEALQSGQAEEGLEKL